MKSTIGTKIKCLAIIMLMLASSSLRGQNYTISGTVIDQTTGETLIGAVILEPSMGKGSVSNSFGRYSFTLPKGQHVIQFSAMGYAPHFDTINLANNMTINVEMNSAKTLNAAVVTTQRPTDPKASQMSAINIPIEHIKSVPVLFGEADILKAVQLLPGVQSGSEGMSGMYVRGGGPDENLFLLDGVPLYNVNHLGGFFSAFNADAVKDVTLYKGSFPAHFGGRLSSVLDITTDNGNFNEIHGGASIGLIAAKVFLEGPIIKEKTTFSISARRTYADALIQPFMSLATTLSGMGTTNAGYYFYDFNAKVTHKFSDQSRIFASFYSGDDVIYARIKTSSDDMYDYAGNYYSSYLGMTYKWGNMVSSLRWNYVINPKLFMNVTGAYTRYRNNMGMSMEDYYDGSDGTSESVIEMSYNSGIQDLTGRVDFEYTPNPDHNVKFGGSVIHHIFSPEVIGSKINYTATGTLVGYENNLDTTLGESRVQAEELNAFIEDDWSINEAIKLNYGVALSGFAVQNTFYPSFQPRLSGRFLLSDDLSVKVGYAYMTQYLHLLSNSSISLPTDLWVPVTAKIKPMNSHQVAAGVFYNLMSFCDLSVEGYYKRMNNLMEYKDGASFWGTSVNWENKVCQGEGWSYGLELLAQRSFGKFTGWVGYTWSKTERQFNEEGQVLNNGLVFPAKYDRRHDISIVLMYKPNNRFDASISWVYSTGNTATLALQEYSAEMPSHDDDNEIPSYDDDNENNYTGILNYYAGRNNYRMPTYHRMDVSLNFHKKLKHGNRTINVSVYNLYNHQNPYMIYKSNNFSYTDANHNHYSNALVQLSIFPIIPSISYSYKF